MCTSKLHIHIQFEFSASWYLTIQGVTKYGLDINVIGHVLFILYVYLPNSCCPYVVPHRESSITPMCLRSLTFATILLWKVIAMWRRKSLACYFEPGFNYNFQSWSHYCMFQGLESIRFLYYRKHIMSPAKNVSKSQEVTLVIVFFY